MARVLINSSTLQKIADAIKAKKGTDKKMLPSEMAEEIKSISGDGEVNLTELVASIADGSYNFGDELAIETAINSRLYSGQKLNSYSNNNLKSIGIDGAFSFSSIITFSAPNLETLSNKSNTFQYCNSLVSADIGKVTVLPIATFYACSKLSEVPNSDILTSIGQQCFSFNNTLTELNLEKVESIGQFAFAQCSNIKIIRLPSIISLTANIFNNSHAISVLEIGDKCTSVINSSLSGCKIELTLIIRAIKPPSLNGSFMLGSGGVVISIRVPAEAVDDYKAAPNWSNYAPIISAI